jgi:hypothetical protein
METAKYFNPMLNKNTNLSTNIGGWVGGLVTAPKYAH